MGISLQILGSSLPLHAGTTGVIAVTPLEVSLGDKTWPKGVPKQNRKNWYIGLEKEGVN